MPFILITFLAAFFIEALGTVVSVIGLSTLFGANPIIIALAISLDVGKLVVVTLLYKYWKDLGTVMRSYALMAAIVTMVITSAGAAGYLSGEFQKAILGTQEIGLKVQVLKQQQTKYEDRKKQIDQQIAALPEKTSVAQRLRLMNGFKAEQVALQLKITDIDKQLPDMQIKQIGVEAKAGPILYIAKAFDTSVEQAVKYVIFMIIGVFDPLAVFLIIAGNFLLDRYRAKKVVKAEPYVREDNSDLNALLAEAIEVAKAPPSGALLKPQEPAPIQHDEPLKDLGPCVLSEITWPAIKSTITGPAPVDDVLDTPTPKTMVEELKVDIAPAPIVHGPVPKTYDDTHFHRHPRGASEPSMIVPPPASAQVPESTPVPSVVAPPVREVITREQLAQPTNGYVPSSSLNNVAADETMSFDNTPGTETTSYYMNRK